MRPDQITYSPQDLTAIVDISYRQVQYWDKSEFLQPSHRRGRFRSYSFPDLLKAKLIRKLRSEYDLSIQQIRRITPSLKAELANYPGCILDFNIVIPDIRAKNPVILTSNQESGRSWPGGRDFFSYNAQNLARDIRNNQNLSLRTRGMLSYEND